MYSERRVSPDVTLWRSSGGAATVIPADGSVDLILIGDRMLVAGPSTVSIQTEADGRDASVGLRWDPGTAGGALSLPLADLRDHHTLLVDLVGRAESTLWLHRLRGLAERERMFGSAPLVGSQAAWPSEVRRLAGAGVSASAAAASLFCSERELRRRMTGEFGYGYRSLVQIIRANRAHALVTAGVALPDVAARTGYADQPHLTREFRRRVGMTPGQLAASSA